MRWLHLSDIHFGAGKGNLSLQRNAVLKKLAGDVPTTARGVNAIFVTGDLSWAGQKAQLQEAQEWLNDLAKTLGGPSVWPSVWVVPGNHDLDRDLVEKKATILSLHQSLRAGKLNLDDVWADSEDRAALLKKLSSYFEVWPADTAAPHYLRPLSTNPPAQVLGLNTALLSHDNRDAPANLRLGQSQLNQLLRLDQITFVLAHHPPSWLADGQDMRALLASQPHVLLTGHVHSPDGTRTQTAAGGEILHLQAGAVHANDTLHYSYSVGELGPKGLTVWAYKWSPNLKEFVPDVESYRKIPATLPLTRALKKFYPSSAAPKPKPERTPKRPRPPPPVDVTLKFKPNEHYHPLTIQLIPLPDGTYQRRYWAGQGDSWEASPAALPPAAPVSLGFGQALYNFLFGGADRVFERVFGASGVTAHWGPVRLRLLGLDAALVAVPWHGLADNNQFLCSGRHAWTVGFGWDPPLGPQTLSGQLQGLVLGADKMCLRLRPLTEQVTWFNVASSAEFKKGRSAQLMYFEGEALAGSLVVRAHDNLPIAKISECISAQVAYFKLSGPDAAQVAAELHKLPFPVVITELSAEPTATALTFFTQLLVHHQPPAVALQGAVQAASRVVLSQRAELVLAPRPKLRDPRTLDRDDARSRAVQDLRKARREPRRVVMFVASGGPNNHLEKLGDQIYQTLKESTRGEFVPQHHQLPKSPIVGQNEEQLQELLLQVLNDHGDPVVTLRGTLAEGTPEKVPLVWLNWGVIGQVAPAQLGPWVTFLKSLAADLQSARQGLVAGLLAVQNASQKDAEVWLDKFAYLPYTDKIALADTHFTVVPLPLIGRVPPYELQEFLRAPDSGCPDLLRDAVAAALLRQTLGEYDEVVAALYEMQQTGNWQAWADKESL